jgi:hypothetical protein
MNELSEILKSALSSYFSYLVITNIKMLFTHTDKGIVTKAYYLSTPGAHSGNSPVGIMCNHSYSQNTRCYRIQTV